MTHDEIYRFIGSILIVVGVLCYFIASKKIIWLGNCYKLNEDQVFEDKKKVWFLLGFLGFLVCSFGLIATGAVRIYNEGYNNILELIEIF